MENKNNSKVEYAWQVLEEASLNCMTFMVAAAVVGSFILLIVK